MNARVKTAIEHWGYVAPLLQPARNAKEYAQLVEALDAAIDVGGADEKLPFARLVDYLGDLVAEYEAKDKMPAAATRESMGSQENRWGQTPLIPFLPPCRGKARMGLTRRRRNVSTPSLPLPLQGGGDVETDANFGLTECHEGRYGNPSWITLLIPAATCQIENRMNRFSVPKWIGKLLPTAVRQPRIGLVLGGGGARGFSHVGVIKVLESQGISPDIIVGTSVGSAVGALYAAGYTGYELQEISLPMQRGSVTSWIMPNRGFMSGEPLEQFINRMVKQQPVEKLQRVFAAVATDLATGEEIVFRTGDTGKAVRASCSVPGIFQPTEIEGKNYVDGGLVKPVAASVARSMGADIVIAVNISNLPENNQTKSTLDVLMQTFDIMSGSINRYELDHADVVIRPVTKDIDQTNLDDKHWAILEGEKAATAALPEIKAKLKAFGEK